MNEEKEKPSDVVSSFFAALFTSLLVAGLQFICAYVVIRYWNEDVFMVVFAMFLFVVVLGSYARNYFRYLRGKFKYDELPKSE